MRTELCLDHLGALLFDVLIFDLLLSIFDLLDKALPLAFFELILLPFFDRLDLMPFNGTSPCTPERVVGIRRLYTFDLFDKDTFSVDLRLAFESFWLLSPTSAILVLCPSETLFLRFSPMMVIATARMTNTTTITTKVITVFSTRTNDDYN